MTSASGNCGRLLTAKRKNVKNFFTYAVDNSDGVEYNRNEKGGIKVKFDDLFEQRSLVAMKLKDYIRTRGFTKVSFAKKADISRPTLDKLLNGSIENKSTFDKHLQKIMAVLNISVDELIFFESTPKAVNAVYSQNAPSGYKMTEKAQKEYGLLMDILDLCEIYY